LLAAAAAAAKKRAGAASKECGLVHQAPAPAVPFPFSAANVAAPASAFPFSDGNQSGAREQAVIQQQQQQQQQQAAVCYPPAALRNDRHKAAVWWVGKRVVKTLNSFTSCGVVERVRWDRSRKAPPFDDLFRIKYDDNDEEDLDLREIRLWYQPSA